MSGAVDRECIAQRYEGRKPYSERMEMYYGCCVGRYSSLYLPCLVRAPFRYDGLTNFGFLLRLKSVA